MHLYRIILRNYMGLDGTMHYMISWTTLVAMIDINVLILTNLSIK